MRLDISVIVTAHDETLVSGPTMTAADLAIRMAEAAGITVERIIALDRPTPATSSYFHQPVFDHWRRRILTFGDVGQVRNALVPEARGDLIAFLDADDLFSSNWLVEGVRRLRSAEASGVQAIVHPELNWLFDGAHSVFWKPDQTDPLFLPEYFYFMNYYDSLCIAPRAAHLEVPYVSRDIPRGLSFQDWQFSIESMAAGWMHVSAPDTIVFKRRRDASLVTQSRARKALVRPLAPMRIDRVSDLSGPRRMPEAMPAQRAPTSREPVVMSGPMRRLFTRVFAPAELGHLACSAEEMIPPAGSAASPFCGEGFAARVRRARTPGGQDKRGRIASITRSYRAIASVFDHAFYLARYPDIAGITRMDPLAHYLRKGAQESRNPSPLFSTSAYRDLYPDVAQSGENPFVHYVLKGRKEGRIAPPVRKFDALCAALDLSCEAVEAAYARRYRDLRHRLLHGALGEQVNRAAQIEPLISLGWPEALQVKVPPFHSDPVAQRLGIFLDLLRAADRRPARFVICLGRDSTDPRRGLDDHLIAALLTGCAPEDICLVITDESGSEASTRHMDVRRVDLARAVSDLPPAQQDRVLVEFLRALAPEAVFNVNANALWRTMSTYGDALAYGTKIVASLESEEQSAQRAWSAASTPPIYRHFDRLHAIVTGSHGASRALCRHFALPPSHAQRVLTWETPVDPSTPQSAARGADRARPQIFCQGDIDRPWNCHLVLDIAAAMPQADFHLFCASIETRPSSVSLPKNVTRHKPQAWISEARLEGADLWLHTLASPPASRVLLDVGMSGVPIVAVDAESTCDIALPGLATLVPGDAGLDPWVTAIDEVLLAPADARSRARRLRTALLQTRGPERYARHVWDLLERGPRADCASPEIETGAASAQAKSP